MVQNIEFSVSGNDASVKGVFEGVTLSGLFVQCSKSGGRITCRPRSPIVVPVEVGSYPVSIQLVVRAGKSGRLTVKNNGTVIQSIGRGFLQSPLIVTDITDPNIQDETLDPVPEIDIELKPTLETISDLPVDPDPVPETNIVPVEAGVINDQDVNFENSFIQTELGKAEEIGIDQISPIDPAFIRQQQQQQEQKSDIKSLILPLAALFIASGG